ncbi:LisH domain-containing protein FOPNL [Myotis davidii]|uniref:Centrosomal protein 20 n=1 Tax=Myotis davidii TaxID=225400 RepID=L5M4P2_MYODS|nr:LisH domain-containing protein FOPNL [Myotis davidii]
MATVTELKAVLKDTLEKRGVLGHLKARIRAEVFKALDDESEPRPTLSHENLLINELIREYLEFNKYKYTSSVLIAESGQPVVPLDRQFLIRELNAFEESKDNTIACGRGEGPRGQSNSIMALVPQSLGARGRDQDSQIAAWLWFPGACGGGEGPKGQSDGSMAPSPQLPPTTVPQGAGTQTDAHHAGQDPDRLLSADRNPDSIPSQ